MTQTIAVTTPTGNVGRRVATNLARLSGEHDLQVVLLARDVKSVSHLLGTRVRVKPGRLEDDGYLEEATRDVDALFLVTPNGFHDGVAIRQGYRAVANQAARAIEQNGIRHTVHLSGFVEVDDQAGEGSMLGGLSDSEKILDEAVAKVNRLNLMSAVSVTHLRAGFFFENFLGQIDTIGSIGLIFVPLDTDIRIPMVASRDVAARSLDALLDTPPAGCDAQSVLGPRDLSVREAATAIGHGLERTVRAVHLPQAVIRMGMLRRGSSRRMTEAMLAIFSAARRHRGLPATPARDEGSTTPTTMAAFAREEIRPLIELDVDPGAMCPVRRQ